MRRGLLGGLVGVVVAALLVVAPASPASADTGEIFTFPGNTHLVHPEGITLGPDRNVWFTNFDSDYIGRITVNGTTTMFHPSIVNEPRGIVTGPDGRLWIGSGANNRIVRMGTNGVATSFTAANVNAPSWLTVGPDGALWFTNRGNGRIGRITTAGAITTFPHADLDQNDVITQIAAGPDGNLWFSGFKGSSLWRFDPDTHVFTEFNGLAAGVSGPGWITVGPDDHLWFASAFNDRIGEIDPLAGNDTAILNSFATYSDPNTNIDNPSGLTLGEDGYLWFSSRDNDRVGRLDPTAVSPAATIETYTGAPAEPAALTAGADGHIWFVAQVANRIGKVETRPCNTNPLPHGYNDVPALSFYEDGLDWARCHAMVAGFSDGGFHPTDPVLRSQVINILWVMMASPTPFPAHGFVDIPASAFYDRAVRWGRAEDLIRGFPGHLYKPGDPVNRCQLSNMMWNMVGAPTGAPASGYTDIPNQLYCRQAVDWATQRGLWDDVVSGSQFGPFTAANRSQVVDVLYELASVSAAWSGFTGDFPRTVRFPH